MELAEIERRKPVWLALSDFYLDTELGPVDFNHIRDVFAESNYSADVIKQINYEEVAPVLIDNLYSMVGIWDGFDEQWLYTTVLTRLDRLAARKHHSWFRWLWRRRVDFFTKAYFQQVLV